jgi:lipopolysaccharide transport system ATP-binding protein
VEHLSKQYVIRHNRTGQETFREALTRAFAAPFRVLTRAAAEREHEEFWALKDVSFEVAKGEVIGIIGHNGAGKSTLLKILSRITEPTEGEIEMRGRVASLLEVGTGFHPELTGRENIYLNGAILGMRRVELQRKFSEIVAFAEVEKFIDTPVKHYSSGMQVRLAFAVAAHLDPEILVVDEVLAVGDLAFQQRCMGKMRSFAGGGRTVLIVSHNMRSISDLCGRVILLAGGAIEDIGPASRIIGKYVSKGRFDRLCWSPAEAQSGPFAYHAVRIVSDSEYPECGIPFIKSFDVVFDYMVSGPLPPNRLSLMLSNEAGEVIFGSAETDRLAALNHSWVQGRSRSRCTIPSHLLAPGRYFISISEPTVDGTSRIHENVLEFAITPEGCASQRDGRSGLITPLLRWETEARAS